VPLGPRGALRPRAAAGARLARTSALHSVATSPELSAPAEYAPLPVGEDAWAASLDYKAFRQEVHALGTRLANEQNQDDVKHLKRMIAWSNACGAIGVATMWMSNPLARLISIVGLSTWTCTRWTMIGHHISHGGYNRQDDPSRGGSGRFTTYGFAVGSVYRRARDWFDWMLPEAWNVEHNNLHHYRLSESGDPDLVERNLEIMREFPLPGSLKYVGVAVLAAMWKWYYYAPNTYKQLKISQMRKAGLVVSEEDAHEAYTLPVALFDTKEAGKYNTGPIDFMRQVMGPYLLIRFFLMPAFILPFSRAAYWTAVANLFLADALSNIHSFIIIATNHCGNDMYKFKNSCTPRSGTFYMRAITSSGNFRTSNGVRKDGTARKVHGFRADVNDFLHGWLNYQIEHHCWPQLSMLSYQKAAPQLRAICEKHGVPYVQQNVFRRLKKTADIMVGATSMRPFDESWEYGPDKFTWADQKTLEAQVLKDQLAGTSKAI
jgi:fatty acid desaturase